MRCAVPRRSFCLYCTRKSLAVVWGRIAFPFPYKKSSAFLCVICRGIHRKRLSRTKEPMKLVFYLVLPLRPAEQQRQIVRVLQKRTAGRRRYTQKDSIPRLHAFEIKSVNSFVFAPYRVQLSKRQSSIVQLDVVVRSENCDAQANTKIQRRKLCGVHNFRRCLWWLKKNVGA